MTRADSPGRQKMCQVGLVKATMMKSLMMLAVTTTVLLAAPVCVSVAHAEPPAPLRCKEVPAQVKGGLIPVTIRYCDFGDHIQRCYVSIAPVVGSPCSDFPESDASKLPGGSGFWNQP
jgi:hypothetical protein